MIGTSLLVAAVVATAGSDMEVVARVDGAAITRGALSRRYEIVRNRGTRATHEQILEGLVNEALLAVEARRLNLLPAFADQIEAEKRKALAEVFVEKELVARAEIGDDRLRDMFHATSDFAWFESLTFETAEAAQAALARLRKGSTFAAEAPKAVVSKAYADPARAPAVMRAQIPSALAKALFAAQPGATVGPVPGNVGFVLARLIKKETGAEATFKARRGALEKTARKQMTAQMREHVGAQLRAKAGVQLDEAFLRGLPPGGGASPAQLEHVLAKVNGQPVRFRDIHGSVQAIDAAGSHLAGPAVKVQLAWQEVETRLLADAARARGYEKDPDVLARTPEIERAVLGQAALDAIRGGAAPPNDREIEAFYRRNAAHYRRPFEQVLPQAAADAADDKQTAHAAERIEALRKKASIVIDRAALARAATPEA